MLWETVEDADMNGVYIPSNHKFLQEILYEVSEF